MKKTISLFIFFCLVFSTATTFANTQKKHKVSYTKKNKKDKPATVQQNCDPHPGKKGSASDAVGGCKILPEEQNSSSSE